MRIQRRHLWYATGVLAAALLAIRMLRPETIAVETAPATVGPLLVTVGDEGQTRVRHRHIVTAPVPGRLERIALEVGDAVPAGAVVARLAPLPLDARSRSQAEAALEASRDLERLRLGAEARQREVEAAEAGARAAAHDVESATDAVRASAGQRMLVTGWGGDSTIEGRVGRVEPAGFTKVSALGLEEQRVNVVGDFLAVPARLGDRFRLDVQLVLWEGDSVLKVPSSALFRRGDRWALFVVEDGRARERAATVGHESLSEAEIAAGVRRGDVVIRHPTDRIRDGTRVTYAPEPG